MYVHKQFEFIFVAFTTLVNGYFDKIIATDSPKSHNPMKNMHFIPIFSIVQALLPIMLALCSILLLSYYVKNYAGIIGSSLFMILKSS